MSDRAEQTAVDYRRSDASEGGEGWPRGRTDLFTLDVQYGPVSVAYDEEMVEDVALWASGYGVSSGVSVALAFDGVDGSECAALAYMDPAAARALAAQLLTAADAVETGETFNPNHDRSADQYHE